MIHDNQKIRFETISVNSFIMIHFYHTDTVRETEEVSCSEEEPEAAEPPTKKISSNASNGSSTNTKKKVSPPDGKKQGSILSFFGKK